MAAWQKRTAGTQSTERSPRADSTPEERLQRCKDAALRFLGHRPRSTSEVHDRLARQKHSDGDIETTLAWLTGLHLIDDEAFAGYWKENRNRFRPKGARAIASELAQRGVASETIRETLKDLDEDDGAYRAGLRQAQRLSTLAYPDFRRKLGQMLFRRGFETEAVARAVDRLWHERHVVT